MSSWGIWIVLAAGLLMFFLVIGGLHYQLKLIRRKGGVSRSAFLAEFQRSGISETISGAVYDHYRGHSLLRSFRVDPDDSLEEVFSQSHDEVDESALELCKQVGVPLPPEEVLRQWPTPLKKVRDMVLWLDWVSGGSGRTKESA